MTPAGRQQQLQQQHFLALAAFEACNLICGVVLLFVCFSFCVDLFRLQPTAYRKLTDGVFIKRKELNVFNALYIVSIQNVCLIWCSFSYMVQ